MYKTGMCLTFVLAISACSSGGSTATTDGTTTGTATEATTGATTNTTAGTTTDGSTTGAETGTTTDGSTTGTATGTTTGSAAGTTTGSTAGVSQYGFIDVSSESGLGVELSASFFSFPQLLPLAALTEELRPSSDFCEVIDLLNPGNTGDGGGTGGFDGFSITSIGAGDVLTISSAAGSYAELIREEQFGFILYNLEDNVMLPAPAPTNLSISIPGDQFPAFTNAPLAVAEPLIVSSPVIGEQLTASTTFTWVPSTNADSRVEISVISQSTVAFIIVDCTVLDDGSFQFPAAIQSQLLGLTGGAGMYRESTTVIQQGNSVLYTTTTAARAN